MHRKRGTICVALIVLAGLLAYSNSFKGTFVFDDELNIAENEAIMGLGSAVSDTVHSRVVGYFTFALNYKIHGLEVEGFHIFNLAIHLINGILVFWLVLLTLKTPFFEKSRFAQSRLTSLIVALFAGLVFVAHPVQTQAVTYMVQRFTSLATLFYLLALALYAKWRLAKDRPEGYSLFGYKVIVDFEVKRGFFYVAALLSALLAMLTKEIAFTLPAVIALWEFFFHKGTVKKRISGLLPFLLMPAVIPLAISTSDSPLFSALGETEPPPFIDYFFTQLRVIVTYLRLFFFPAGQNLDYDYPVYHSFLDPNVLFSFIFLLAIAGLGVFLWRHSNKKSDYSLLRLASFGIFWFFITLSVESSFITITDVIYEHRFYLPAFGLIISLASIVAFATFALKERLPAIGRVMIPLAAVVVVVLAVAAFERNRIWNDPITLWEDTVKKSPGKARGHYNLGYYYQQIEQTERAETEYLLAIGINRDQYRAHTNLGNIYQKKGLLDMAETEYLLAIGIKPDYFKAHNNLGVLYKARGQLDKAEAAYNLAAELRPANAEIHYNLGVLYKDRGRYEDAESELKKALALQPANAQALYHLGIIYSASNRLDMAEVVYKRAIDVKPDYAAVYFNLAMNYIAENRFQDAIYPLAKTIELTPENYEAHNKLGNIYVMQKQYDKALAEFQAALSIKPDYEEAKINIKTLEGMKM